MKKRKEQPSLAGLLLIVAGMVLLSILLLSFAGSSRVTDATGKVMIGLACAAVVSIAAGATLSARGSRKKR